MRQLVCNFLAHSATDNFLDVQDNLAWNTALPLPYEARSIPNQRFQLAPVPHLQRSDNWIYFSGIGEKKTSAYVQLVDFFAHGLETLLQISRLHLSKILLTLESSL